jgi:hydroxyethylthiazole kinase-like sugar kinase family protein
LIALPDDEGKEKEIIRMLKASEILKKLKTQKPLVHHLTNIGAFSAVSEDPAEGAAAGLCCFGIAAECAAERSCGPGSFKEELFDCVYLLDAPLVDFRQRIEQR